MGVVVHNVVQDLNVVSSLHINTAAGFVVDRIVLDRDVIGEGDAVGGIDTYAVPIEARVAAAVPCHCLRQGVIGRIAYDGKAINNDVGRPDVDGVPTARAVDNGR